MRALKALRRRAGLTVRDLASALGVSYQSVYNWENGAWPNAELLPRIAEALGCEIRDLYEDEKGNKIRDGLLGLRVRRKAAGLTQAELGDRLGCSHAAVGMWERGEMLPAADKLPELARVLGCSIDELFIVSDSDTEEENTGGAIRGSLPTE